MSGPVAAKQSLTDVQLAADEGEWTTAQVVYILDLSDFVIVIPPNGTSPSKVYRPVYTDVDEYVNEYVEVTIERDVPGIISTVDPYESTPVIDTPCANQNFADLQGVNAYGAMPREPILTEYTLWSSGSSRPNAIGPIVTTEGSRAIAVGKCDGSYYGDEVKVLSAERDTIGDVLWTFTMPGTGTNRVANTGYLSSRRPLDYKDGKIYGVGRSANGINPAVDVAFLYCANSSGIVWSLEGSTAAQGGFAAVSPTGNLAAGCGGAGNTWSGGGTNEEMALVNAATGALLDTADYTTEGYSSANVGFCFNGDGTKLLAINHQYGADPVNCYDVTGNTFSLDWSIDPSVDYTNTPGNGSSRVIWIDSLSLWCYACTVTGYTFLYFIDEAGAVDHEVVIPHADMTTASIDELQLRDDGRLWVKMSSSTAPYRRFCYLESPYTLSELELLNYEHLITSSKSLGSTPQRPDEGWAFLGAYLVEGLYDYPSSVGQVNIGKLRF